MAEDYQGTSVRNIRSRFAQARDMGHDDKTATDFANGKITLDEADERRRTRRKDDLSTSVADIDSLDPDGARKPPFGRPDRPAEQTAANRKGATGDTKIGAGAVEIPEGYADLAWNKLRSLAKSIKDDVIRGKDDAIAIIEEEIGRRRGAPDAGNDAGNYKPTENAGQDETERGRQERSKGQALDDGGAGGQGDVIGNNAKLAKDGIDDAAGKNDDAELANNKGKPADQPVEGTAAAAAAADDDPDHERLESGDK